MTTIPDPIEKADWRETVLLICTLWGMATLPFVLIGGTMWIVAQLVFHLQIGWRP